MASNSAVRDQNSGRAGTFDQRRVARAIPEVWAGLLTILIAGPWLGGGYIFGTDWPGPRRFDFPTDLSSSAPAAAALAAISRVIPGEWTGKLVVLGLLFIAAAGAYRAVPRGSFVPRG